MSKRRQFAPEQKISMVCRHSIESVPDTPLDGFLDTGRAGKIL